MLFSVLIILSLFVAIAVIGLMVFAGGAIAAAENPQPDNDARQTLEAALKAYHDGKLEVFETYFADGVYGDLDIKKLAAQSAATPAAMQELVSAIGKHTKCTIQSVNVSKNNKKAEASVSVVPIDFGHLLQKKTAEVAQHAETGKYKGMSEEELFDSVFTAVAKDFDKAKKRPKETLEVGMSVDASEAKLKWKFDDDTLVYPTCGGLLR